MLFKITYIKKQVVNSQTKYRSKSSSWLNSDYGAKVFRQGVFT